MKRVTKYSPETRERAVRLVWEQAGQHTSEWGDQFDRGEGRLNG